ncbi:MAG: hypothetical protein GKR94_29670 [Gammaproteobacteria bacterium]|nr:hypothetical protein [Gammaproteobacteria bacterium]
MLLTMLAGVVWIFGILVKAGQVWVPEGVLTEGEQDREKMANIDTVTSATLFEQSVPGRSTMGGAERQWRVPDDAALAPAFWLYYRMLALAGDTGIPFDAAMTPRWSGPARCAAIARLFPSMTSHAVVVPPAMGRAHRAGGYWPG